MNEQKTIFVAEDDKFIYKLLKFKLPQENFNVVMAEDGLEATEKLKNIKPDLILLDLIMPKKNGFEVLEFVRKELNMKDVPIIILTNLGQDSDIAKGKQLGATDYLIKSNTPINDVIKKIKQHL